MLILNLTPCTRHSSLNAWRWWRCLPVPRPILTFVASLKESQDIAMMVPAQSAVYPTVNLASAFAAAASLRSISYAFPAVHWIGTNSCQCESLRDSVHVSSGVTIIGRLKCDLELDINPQEACAFCNW